MHPALPRSVLYCQTPHLDNGAFSCVKSPALLMQQTPHNAGKSLLSGMQNLDIHGRISRAMIVATACAVVGSLVFADWRITTGLVLGGILALLNHRWLRSSTAAVFSVLVEGDKPKLRLTHYFLRYMVVGAVVFVAYQLNVVSLAATLIGLCSFVAAIFVEAFREFYFAFIQREEIN